MTDARTLWPKPRLVDETSSTPDTANGTER